MLVTFAFPGHSPATHRRPWCAKVTSWPDNSPPVLVFGGNNALDAEPGDVVCWGAKTLAGMADPTLSGWGVVTKAGISPCSKEDARHERRMRHPEDAQAAPVVVIPGSRRYGKTAAASRRNPDPNGPKPDWGAALKALAAHDALTAERDALRAHLAEMVRLVEERLAGFSNARPNLVQENKTAMAEALPGAKAALAGIAPGTTHPDNKTVTITNEIDLNLTPEERSESDAFQASLDDNAPMGEATAALEPGLRPVLPEF